MKSANYIKGPRKATIRPWEIVVPSGTSSLPAQRAPLDTIATIADTILAPELNSIVPGTAITRKNTKSRRAIFLALRTDSILSTAPPSVQSLAISLANSSYQAYILHSVTGGDTWIVGNGTDSIRHGCYDYLNRLGIEYLNPHPAWRVDTGRSSYNLDVSEICEPAYRSFAYVGNGGFGSSVNPAVPNRSLQIDRWQSWFTQCRNPSDVEGGYGDGDEGYIKDRQDELRHDHTLLAWVDSLGVRGFSDSGSWPSTCFGSSNVPLAKICNTHHGSSGSYPAAPAGPSPWLGIVHRTEDCATPAPGGPLTPDPGPDTNVNPSTSYTTFGGGVALHATHHWEKIASKIASLGYPHPQTRFVSSEPPDGQFKCECDRCIDLLRNGPYSAWLSPTQQSMDSSFSDRVWHTMNQDQLFLQHMFQNASPAFVPSSGMLAYNTHAEPPNIPIHQNSICLVLDTASQNYQRLASEIHKDWIEKRSNNAWGQFDLGVTPQWLTDNTAYAGLYWPSPIEAAKLNSEWISNNYKILNAQSGYSGLTSGIIWWLLAKQTWNPSINTTAELNYWFDLAFGPCASPIKTYYERAWNWWERTHHEIALMLQAADDAQNLLDAAIDPVEPDGRSRIQARLDHFRAFVHYQRLFLEYDDAVSARERGQLLASGTLPPRVYMTGARSSPCVIRIEIEPGATTFRWTRNADAGASLVWEQTGVAIPYGSVHTLTGTGFVARFASGIYSADNIYSEETYAANEISKADAVISWCWRCVQFNAFHSSRIAEKVYGRIPFPISRAAEGTTPPNVQIFNVPSAGTTSVDVEITTGGTETSAIFRWRRNGGAWVSGVTAALTQQLVAAGVWLSMPVGTYTTSHKWHFTIPVQIEKWLETNASASANWTTLVEPTKLELDALISDGLSNYSPTVGVTRRIFSDTYNSFNPSSSTTLHSTHQTDSPSFFIIKTPGTCTLKVNSNGLGATPGKPVRIQLEDLNGNLLQTFYSQPDYAGQPTVTTDIVITQPAGTYKLKLVVVANCQSLTWLSVPENVGCVWINDEREAPASITRGFASTNRWYFYVPTGETKILLSFNTLGRTSGVNTQLVTFFDPSGVETVATRIGQSQWEVNVGAGQDNKVWSFTGLYSLDNNRKPQFENCPNRIAPSQYQVLIP